MLPAHLRRDLGLAVRASMVVAQKLAKAAFKIGYRKATALLEQYRDRGSPACVHRNIWLTVAKKRSTRPRPRGCPGVEKIRRILMSAATCSRCFEVKSVPLSV